MTENTTVRKKLIEVSIPLEAINAASEPVKRKAPKGYFTGLHKYWSQKPLPASRGILFAQLVDDPSAWPDIFPTKVAQDAERSRLHKLIAKMVPWEASSNETILNEARYEIARSVARGRGADLPPIGRMRPKEIIDYLQENAPPVNDPFSGGCSIPLEAQRLGLKAMGSDLNPVAVLIGKALIEFPPKFAGRKPVNPEVNELHQWTGAQGLAEDVRYYSGWMREQAEKKIGHLYPKVTLAKNAKETTVVAWLWVRTVPSPDPRAKGTHVPLASSFVLSTRSGKEVIVKPIVDRVKMTWAFEVDHKPSKIDIEKAKSGTKSARGSNFTCLLTGAAIDAKYIKDEAMNGRMSMALMAIVADGDRGRVYVAPMHEHAKAAVVEPPEVPEIDQPLPYDPRAIWVTLYGLDRWTKLFTPRQLLAVTTFSDLVLAARERVLADAKKVWSGTHADDTRRLFDEGLGPVAYADTVACYHSIILGRMIGYSCSITSWLPKDSALRHAMPRQSIQMMWETAEANPLGKSSGDFETCTKAIAAYLDQFNGPTSASVSLRDACSERTGVSTIICTDPPYYDNISYADLTDFFYVWHRRTLASILPELFRRVITPKSEELVANPYRHGSHDVADVHFMEGMAKALKRLVEQSTEWPTTIFYAYKEQELAKDGITSAGWASFLEAVIQSGFAIDGTWPIRSEGSQRANSNDANALSSSILLVCRRRLNSEPTITRADFIRALRREMPAALDEIKSAGIGPTDIQQAAIGPGIGIFTRYSEVLNTDGTPMPVRDALKLINQVREEIASTGDADYDSETRFALDWFATKGFEKGKSGDAIVMTNAVNVSLDSMNAVGFFEARGGDARLLKRNELPDDWDPAKDTRGTVWEACQHLIKRLTAEDGGIEAAAALYNRLGALADPAHALARRLYDICEQKQWASEGRVYNQLHQEWVVIEKCAAELAKTRADLFGR